MASSPQHSGFTFTGFFATMSNAVAAGLVRTQFLNPAR
jgi:hypothetical protein